MQKLKQIKFNLLVDNVPVRSLEELHDNFNISDIHEYFVSGQLLNWLNSRNYTAEAKAVAAIDRKMSIEKYLPKLLDALHWRSDECKKALHLFLFETRERITQRSLELERRKCVEENLTKGIQCYQALCQEIIEVKDDFDVVKAGVETLLSHYGSIFEIDYMRFFETMLKNCPLAIFAVLMDEKYRHYFFPVSSEAEKDSKVAGLTSAFNTMLNEFAKCTKVYGKMDQVEMDAGEIIYQDHSWYSKGYLKILAGKENNTEGNWDRVTDKKVMIIHWENVSLQEWENFDKEKIYDSQEQQGRFPILKNLERRTNADSSVLLYMEV